MSQVAVPEVVIWITISRLRHCWAIDALKFIDPEEFICVVLIFKTYVDGQHDKQTSDINDAICCTILTSKLASAYMYTAMYDFYGL